jgi:hypothetical protein
MAVLERIFSDPKLLPKEIEKAPELAELIRRTNYPEGSCGAFVKQGFEAVEAERADPKKIINIRRHRGDEQ